MGTRLSPRLSTWAASLLLGVSAWGPVAVAAPHDPNTAPSVVATPLTVTLNRDGLAIEAGYLVTFLNDTTGNLNFVSLTGTTNVRASGATASIVQVINLNTQGVACTAVDNTSAGTSTVTCNAGTLAPGKSLALVVVATSPASGSFIDFSWTLKGSEGNSTNGCCATTGTASTQLIDPVTDATSKSHVQSFLRPVAAGVNLFTGLAGVATSTDPWATKVFVPNFASTLLPYTTADVDEKPFGNGASCSAVNLSCNQSTLTIPNLLLNSSDISVRLQQHPSILKNGAKLAEWRIGYAVDGIDFVELQQCSTTGGASSGVPCIASCKEYTKKSDPLLPALWGIFECNINAKDNGSYRPL